METMPAERDWKLQESVARQHQMILFRMTSGEAEEERNGGAEDQMVEAEKEDCFDNFRRG